MTKSVSKNRSSIKIVPKNQGNRAALVEVMSFFVKIIGTMTLKNGKRPTRREQRDTERQRETEREREN